jgi:hypothetical protein
MSARYTIRNLTTYESRESFSENLGGGGVMRSGEVLLAAEKVGLASWPWPLGHWGVVVKRLAVSAFRSFRF